MAIDNPQANYQWKLVLDGIEMDRIQRVTPPKVDYAVHKQGSAGKSPDKKTPGKKMVGEMTVEMVIPDDGSDATYNKLQECETQVRSVYAGIGYLYELDPSGAPHTTYYLGDTWFSSVESSKLETKSESSDNSMRTVVIQVEDYRKM